MVGNEDLEVADGGHLESVIQGRVPLDAGVKSRILLAEVESDDGSRQGVLYEVSNDEGMMPLTKAIGILEQAKFDIQMGVLDQEIEIQSDESGD